MTATDAGAAKSFVVRVYRMRIEYVDFETTAIDDDHAVTGALETINELERTDSMGRRWISMRRDVWVDSVREP